MRPPSAIAQQTWWSAWTSSQWVGRVSFDRWAIVGQTPRAPHRCPRCGGHSIKKAGTTAPLWSALQNSRLLSQASVASRTPPSGGGRAPALARPSLGPTNRLAAPVTPIPPHHHAHRRKNSAVRPRRRIAHSSRRRVNATAPSTACSTSPVAPCGRGCVKTHGLRGCPSISADRRARTRILSLPDFASLRKICLHRDQRRRRGVFTQPRPGAAARSSKEPGWAHVNLAPSPQAHSAGTAGGSRVTICRPRSQRRIRDPIRCGTDPGNPGSGLAK